MGERPTHLTFREPDHSGQSTKFCQVSPREFPPSIKWMSLESVQSMGVLMTEGALTRRGVPNGPSKLARPRVVVLHPFVGDSEERGGPSKGCEDHEATPSKHTPRMFMLLRGSGDLVETKPTFLQCSDDHFMPKIAHNVVHIHGANGFCDGHERSFTFFASLVPASASDTHYVLQRIRANVKSPRPHHGPKKTRHSLGRTLQ